MVPTTSIDLKRHYYGLTVREVDEVVEAVANLIVDFLKGKRDPEQWADRRRERAHESNVS